MVGVVFYGFELVYVGDIGGVMGMYYYVQWQGVFQGFDQVVGGIGGEQVGYVFDGDGVDVYVGYCFVLGDEGFDGVYWVGGVVDGVLGVFVGGFYCFDGDVQVMYVVYCVEDVEYVDVVDCCFGYEGVYYIVVVVVVVEQVLFVQEYLQVGVGQCCFEFVQVFLWVFFEEVYVGVEGGVVLDFQ